MRARERRGFTLLELLLALTLVGLLLVAMNTLVFSMGELWGRGSEPRLLDHLAELVLSSEALTEGHGEGVSPSRGGERRTPGVSSSGRGPST